MSGVILFLLSIFSLLLSVFFYRYHIKNKTKLHVLLQENRALISEIEARDQSLVKMQLENEENDKIVRLVKQSPNAIMMMDRDGNVLSVNDGFVNMYEYTYNEFIATRGSNYRRTSFNPKVTERISYIMNNKIPFKYEALNITKSGRELWTQTALVPLLDINGNVDGMVTIDTDIHNRIVASDKLIERMESINARIDSMSREFRMLESETRGLFETINQLQELINQTDQIVRFIKEISDRTKILGINASIEANIAGSYGRGFRVIANEIVEISNKTISSVQEIAQLLSSVSTNQEQLQKEKQISEESISSYQLLIKTLKKDIMEIEVAINEFKTLT